MFNTYNEKSCQFECRLRHAINVLNNTNIPNTTTEEEMGDKNCLPWDFPVPEDLSDAVSKHFCFSAQDSNHNYLEKFDRAMNSDRSLDNCSHCLPNCQEVVFKTQESSVV